ncbi:AraC family transcriptional regulator [Aliikangiella maris]|uniref:AraC family transcriptional regulator n=2 Tax=Aliikangiella maris TaxID=3162458 RepID=A0ABV3MU18_9GAMM
MNNTLLRIKKVEQYIERSLDEDLSVEKLAAQACYSVFHFHRLFKAYFGESVYAYKKRLLLERSVKQLVHSQQSITEIALNAGYENQSAFNKAFRQMFGQTPTQCRQQKNLHCSPSHLTNKVKTMQVDIIQLQPISIISARGRGDYATAANQAWSCLMHFMYSNRYMQKQTRMFGITYDDPSVTEPDNIRYDACVSNDQQLTVSGELANSIIQGGTYARALHKGPYERLNTTYEYLFYQWLPESQYQLRDLPPFEKYLNRDPRRTKPENLRTEVYIPVMR